jgi:hypothetical protein
LSLYGTSSCFFLSHGWSGLPEGRTRQPVRTWLTEDAVIDTARRIGVVVHAVRVESDRFLDRLVDSVGGRTWSATSGRQLQELFMRALEEMRARYLLTYTPHGVGSAGWHDLKVRLKSGRADVAARPGYFVAAASPSGLSRPR